MKSNGNMICYGISMFVSLVLGIFLVTYYVTEHHGNEDEHNSKYIYTSGRISNITQNSYQCWETHGCNKCNNGDGLIDCNTLRQQQRTGDCSTGNGACCRRQTYTYPCGKSTCSSTRCVKRYSRKKCYVITGTCNDVTIHVRYYVDHQPMNSYDAVHCGIDRQDCIDNFILDRKIGDTIRIHYERDNPSAIHVDPHPEYEMSGSHITAIVFGALFLTCFLCLVCCFTCNYEQTSF